MVLGGQEHQRVLFLLVLLVLLVLTVYRGCRAPYLCSFHLTHHSRRPCGMRSWYQFSAVNKANHTNLTVLYLAAYHVLFPLQFNFTQH